MSMAMVLSYYIGVSGRPPNYMVYLKLFNDTNNKLIRKINEEGKIESIFGINTRKSKFEDRYDTNQYNKMILPRNLKFYNKKILLVSDHFNHQILAISIK